ncbi:oxidoreductase, partial [Bacillus toyonensis]
VKDDAISTVSESLKDVNGLVVHTSGATAIDALSALKNYGVLYPLQTFSKAKPIDFANVPLCIEASNTASLA